MNTQAYVPYLRAILRMVAGYMFMLHGTAKFFAIPHNPMFDQLSLFSMYGFSGVLELVGGTLILLGLFTRPVAFILAGEMAVAYFIGHVSSGGYVWAPLMNGGEAAVLYCFVFLYLSVAGGGAWALGNRLCNKHRI